MPITIDGSKFEGGGSMLRIAIACSIATGKPFRMVNIRKNRDNPGLRPQHLASVKLAQFVSSGYAEGAELGSTELFFIPARVQSGAYDIDIKTAGSIALCLQSVIMPIAFSGHNVTLRLKGGTDVNHSPGIDYFKFIFSHAIRNYAEIKTDVIKRGYYPKGQGRVDVRINSKYNSLDASGIGEISLNEKKDIRKISLKINASKDLAQGRVIERLSEYFVLLSKPLGIDTAISQSYNDTESTGGSATLIVNAGEDFIGETRVFERGVKAESIAEELYYRAKILISSNACDIHLTDQLIPFIATAGSGSIKAEDITEHSRANAYVCNEFFENKVKIDEDSKIISVSEANLEG